ncbi:uncharacterized protein L201_001038 [Kwoniella dendrophila CBS 6074]|uniref:Uncharacterized protein n=1 Tax=Kwoniella dendrophila CBS 6074 TaxID=1295534 RepID=A0AAX4JNN1_9TREE
MVFRVINISEDVDCIEYTHSETSTTPPLFRLLRCFVNNKIDFISIAATNNDVTVTIQWDNDIWQDLCENAINAEVGNGS